MVSPSLPQVAWELGIKGSFVVVVGVVVVSAW